MLRTQALAVPARLSVLPAQVRARVGRPEGFVEGTRWLFVMLVLVSLVLALPAPLSEAHGTMWLVGVASAVVLGLSVCAGYLRRSAPLAMDLVDAAAMAALALASSAFHCLLPRLFFLIRLALIGLDFLAIARILFLALPTSWRRSEAMVKMAPSPAPYSLFWSSTKTSV